MNACDDKIRQVMAELDVYVAEVEASVAVLKALLACGMPEVCLACELQRWATVSCAT
jgi:hypothetical protein